ncbi:hypothetical protein QYE76_030643 [Lolium multiflorum]|uniref:F-box/LRR-repeat protein 15/At3g58940/PEG3-like LRR domain-containing protein n=1 Tax=Lolium multiflorum TaxID=4521 RepID=A0AAD8QR78_LOLMU|nr:hypothetical protein QYE76_030643 [Lolium multiflorum]
MGLTPKRRRRSAKQPGGVDYISALPDDLLLLILAGLGCTAAAARTSGLSRRWRGLWARLGNISLRDVAFESLAAVLSLVARPPASAISLLEIRVPRQNRRVPREHWPVREDVASLARVAARLAPETVVLALPPKGSIPNPADFHLPCFRRAVSVVLESLPFVLRAPPAPGGDFFPALHTLRLLDCIVVDKELGALLSRCPRLRVLELRHKVTTWPGVRARRRVRSVTLQELILHSERPWLSQVDIVAPMLKQLTMSFWAHKEATISVLAPTMQKVSWRCSYAQNAIGFGLWSLHKLKLETAETPGQLPSLQIYADNNYRKASVPVLSVRIGDHCYYGLCDIGASISAIPYELYTEIMHEIGSCELEDIDVVIRLANRETISPIGIVRDVEVLCDCKKEKIVTKFAGESYEFNFSKFAKTPYKTDLPNDDFRVEQCASIALAPNNPLHQHLENSESEVFREERDELDEIFLRQPILKHDLPVEDLGVTPPPKEGHVFDLKPLPDNLKYAYIDDKKIYPVIISAKLLDIEEERLLEILKKHRGAIGYTLDDLKGISPAICQHAINIEDGAKPVVEHQRRLIPKMKDVVRNEVLKLLEADRKGADNHVADNLSRLENIAYDPVPVNDSFPNEQLAAIKDGARRAQSGREMEGAVLCATNHSASPRKPSASCPPRAPGPCGLPHHGAPGGRRLITVLDFGTLDGIDRCVRSWSRGARGAAEPAMAAVFAQNIPAMCELHFAVPMSGVVLCALNSRLASVLLRHSEAKVIFVDVTLLGVAQEALRLLSAAGARAPSPRPRGGRRAPQPPHLHGGGAEADLPSTRTCIANGGGAPRSPLTGRAHRAWEEAGRCHRRFSSSARSPPSLLQFHWKKKFQAFKKTILLSKEKNEAGITVLVMVIYSPSSITGSVCSSPPRTQQLVASTMVSNNKDKGPLEEDIQDPELKEEVESEDEEEVEEIPRVHPRATVASIGVIANPSNTKRSARIATGGGVPRRFLAPRTSSPGIYHPFRNLIYSRQTERTPKVVLPSGWDIDRSNTAGEMKPEAEGWVNNSKNWDSPSDMLMSRVEHNSELIRNLTYEIEDIKELVKKLVEKNPPPSPPKE